MATLMTDTEGSMPGHGITEGVRAFLVGRGYLSGTVGFAKILDGQ